MAPLPRPRAFCARALRGVLVLGGLLLPALGIAQRTGRADSELIVQQVRIDAVAPDVTVRTIGMRDGLPQGTVLRLERDLDGYVWGATFGGIFRFDGQQLLGFDARGLPPLDANGATMLAGTQDGSLYFGTAGGRIGRLDHGRLVDTLPSLPPDRHVGVNDLIDDGRGTLWVRIGERVLRFRAGAWESNRTMPHIWTRFARTRDGSILWGGWRVYSGPAAIGWTPWPASPPRGGAATSMNPTFASIRRSAHGSPPRSVS